jgi:hypothetical protein
VQHATQQHITNHTAAAAAAAAAANSLEARARSELSLFMREPILPMNHEDGSFTNRLVCWMVNATRFPMVANLAMQILATPATSAPS